MTGAGWIYWVPFLLVVASAILCGWGAPGERTFQIGSVTLLAAFLWLTVLIFQAVA